MAEKLFLDIISGQINFGDFQSWLSGKDTQVIDDSLSKTDFVLVVLKYIQEDSNKFLPATSPTSTTQTLKNDQSPQDKSPSINHDEKRLKVGLVENEFKNQRTPFQVINKVTPSRTSTPQFSRHPNNGYDIKQDVLHGSPIPDGRTISTSTPLHPRRNNSKNNYLPISPPNSFHSDHSSLSHTPRSSKSSRFNSSPRQHHFSPNSPQSPTFSPSSPQYSDNFPDLSGKSRQRAPQSPCLGDFITIKPASQKSRKRIKPTQLSTPEKDEPVECKKGNEIPFGSVSRPFVPMTSMQTEIKEKSNFDEERNLLKQKRTQNLKSIHDNPSPYLTSTPTNKTDFPKEKQGQTVSNNSICLNISAEKSVTKIVSSPQSVKYVAIDPNPKLVRSLEKIERLASVYSACLDANLVPNVTLELFNIFTLLTAGYKSKVLDTTNSSKGSIIYENAKESSSSSGHSNNILEKLTLTDTTEHDDSIEVSKEETVSQDHSETKSILSSVHDCVMFSACVIKKQIHTIQCLDKGIIRLLIENERLSLFLPEFILHLIQVPENKEAKETDYILSKRSFSVGNGPVLYHNETDNQDNFSSRENFNFFKKQRDIFYEILHEWKTKHSENVWVSKRFPQRVQTLLSLSSDPINMMHLARLFCAQMTSSKQEERPDEELELAGVSRDKLTRLQARFSKPAEGGGSPRPPPVFPTEQQFYQQFLQLAVGSTFLQHVTDCLSHRLCLLDHTDFFTDGLSKEESKLQLQACVSTSCLVAKFLGFLTFLPYRSNMPLAPDTLQAQIMVRDQVVPPVNLLPQLQRALATDRLVVTVPWLVAFLGMMDSVAPYLACYHSLLQLLVSIYKALPLPHLSSLSNLLLRCSLGWLFDVSFFPQHVFFSLLSNSGGLDVRDVGSSDADVRDLVDHTLVAEVCPYLVLLRQLLTPNAGVRQGTARHITPVPAQLTPPTSMQTSLVQTMELQLEECFLNGQSTSFRNTVEMIVDRVSSSCIKLICSNIIAPAKERAGEEIKQRKEELKSTNKQEVQDWIAEQCQKTEKEMEAALLEHCGAKIGTALNSLLEPDLTDPTLCKMTHAICSRRCQERIVNWLNSHIKLAEMFSKAIPGPESKPATDLLKPVRSVEHRDSAVAPADMIIELQDKLCECIETRSSVMSEEQVVDLISRALETVQHRSDLIYIAEHTIFTLTVDLCIVLLAYAPSTVTPATVHQLCALWSVCGAPGTSQLERIMSARNTLLLCQGGTPCARESWQRLSLVLVELLKHSPPLLTPSQLETQCVALFRSNWPPMVLTLMGACLSSVLEQIKNDPISKQNPKFVLMLEWVNEMTEDLARDDNFDDLS